MKIGLVGCGPWGGNILRDLKILNCEVFVAARNPSSVARANHGEASVIVGSPGELEQFNCVGFVVTTEASNHAAAIGDLMRFGKPIFVEKPMVTNLADIERLASMRPELVFVMDKWRYHPGVKVLAELVKSGTLGEIHGIRTRRNQWGNPHPDCDSPWTLLPHDLAIVEELIGEVPALRSVEFDESETEVFGVLARFGEKPWFALESFSRSPRPEREVLVLGSNGMAVLGGGYSEEVLFYPNGTVEPECLAAKGEWPLLAELREFVGYLAGERAPRSNFTDGARHANLVSQILAWPR